MHKRLFLFFLITFYLSYEVGDQVSYYDQLKQYDVCYGSEEHGFGPDGFLSFSDFNGSNSNFHVFFIDLAASWWGPCWSNIGTMSDIEEFYFDHENVLVFANLDDIGQPYSCEDWGDRGVQFGASPLITDDGPG